MDQRVRSGGLEFFSVFVDVVEISLINGDDTLCLHLYIMINNHRNIHTQAQIFIFLVVLRVHI